MPITIWSVNTPNPLENARGKQTLELAYADVQETM